MRIWKITQSTPAHLALQYAFGPHHYREVTDGIQQAGAPLPPADILVDVACAHGHASSAVIDAVGLAEGARRIHVDHHPVFAESAKALGADFMSLDVLTWIVSATRGQVVTVVVSHLANQYETTEEKTYLDACLRKLHNWIVEQTMRGARVFVVALEPGYWRARSAACITSVNPGAWVAQRSWSASPANQTKRGGDPKSFVITELRNPASILQNVVSPADLDAKVAEVPMGFGQVFHDPIPITLFRIPSRKRDDRDIHGLAPEDVEEFIDAMMARRDAYEARLNHDHDLLGAYGDAW